MITQLIFDWAKQTPNRTAIIYNNGRPVSYRSFAECIAGACRYFARRGYVGPGYAALAVKNRMGFWILSLALRSLGLTTVVVAAARGGNRRLSNVRCIVTSSTESWPDLPGVCVKLRIPLLSVPIESLFSEPAPYLW
jgi:non-ribosomal peptide synthetase component E (peptide arylation enzyme)